MPELSLKIQVSFLRIKNLQLLLAQNGISIVKVTALNAHVNYGSLPMHV